MLLGEDAENILLESKAAVFGVGGVGAVSYTHLVQVFGESVCRHACVDRLRKLGRAACPFSAFGGNKLGNRIQYLSLIHI